jgi:hypothetical protein
MGGGYTWRGQPSGITSRDRATGLMEWIQKQAKDRDMTVTELAANQPEVFYDLVKSFDRKWLGAGVPKLRRGEKQGDIFAAQTEDLTLAVETGVDWGERQRQAEIAEQERIKAQLKQDEAQGSLVRRGSATGVAGRKARAVRRPGSKTGHGRRGHAREAGHGAEGDFRPTEVGKVRPYSQALWDAIGMVKPELRATHDWTKAYGDDQRRKWESPPTAGFCSRRRLSPIILSSRPSWATSAASCRSRSRSRNSASASKRTPRFGTALPSWPIRATRRFTTRGAVRRRTRSLQGLADMGLLRDGDVDELWSTLAQISNSSKSLERQERDQAREQKRLEAEAATQPPEEEPFEDPFAIDEVGDRVRIMQPTLHGPAPATGHIDQDSPRRSRSRSGYSSAASSRSGQLMCCHPRRKVVRSETMTQVDATIWNQIASSQPLTSRAAKIAFKLDREQLALQEHYWMTLQEDLKTPPRVARCLPTFLPLLIENRAISSFLNQHPQYRNALPEVLSPKEAVALATTDYRLTPTEQKSLEKILSSPRSLKEWELAAKAAERS